MNHTKKHVTFDQVEVREYPVVLSSNPAASEYGPSIELGWEYQAAEILPTEKSTTGRIAVDEYERLRPSSRRRKQKQFYLYLQQRVNRVKESYTEEEIQQAVQEKKVTYKRRQRSNFWRNPVNLVQLEAVSVKREKKIKRALRNLKQKRDGNIYSGWWFPLSGFIL